MNSAFDQPTVFTVFALKGSTKHLKGKKRFLIHKIDWISNFWTKSRKLDSKTASHDQTNRSKNPKNSQPKPVNKKSISSSKKGPKSLLKNNRKNQNTIQLNSIANCPKLVENEFKKTRKFVRFSLLEFFL